MILNKVFSSDAFSYALLRINENKYANDLIDIIGHKVPKILSRDDKEKKLGFFYVKYKVQVVRDILKVLLNIVHKSDHLKKSQVRA